MTLGIRLKANPTQEQRRILSQWMGCARYIWNAKTWEEKEGREALNSKQIRNTLLSISPTRTLKAKERPRGSLTVLV